MEWLALREEVEQATQRVGALLRAFPDGLAVVPPLTWTVGEVGAHLLSLPRRYLAQMAQPVPTPPSMAVFNQACNAAIDLRDPAELAEALERENSAFLDRLGADVDAPVAF